MPGISCSFSLSMLIAPAAIFLHTAAARSVPIWHVGTYKGPVVPRGEVQLRSASAPLDRPLLAIQIGGIVGGYVIFVALVLSLLLFVGRRLRRAAQTSNYTLEMQMLKPPAKPSVSTDPSPATPVSKDLPSPGKKSGFSMSWSSLSKANRSHASPNNSVSAFDESVVAADRKKMQDEMEKLYAAVMEYEEQKASGMYDAQAGDPSSPSKSPLNNVPPEFQNLRYQNPPRSQGDVSLQQQEPVSRQGTSSRSSSRLSKISNLSIFNPGSRSSSSTSNKLRSPRISIRKLPISPPIRSPDMANAASYGEDQPLTPRHYNPGPPPPAPNAEATAKMPMSATVPRQTETTHTRAPPPAPLKLGSASNGSSSLPFRQAFGPLQSAPATKTTILERPENPDYGLRTGVPTPYSPYMPFTPVTPITPSRMVTKQERKRKEKENGLRVLVEDDMVKSDEEIWGI